MWGPFLPPSREGPRINDMEILCTPVPSGRLHEVGTARRPVPPEPVQFSTRASVSLQTRQRPTIVVHVSPVLLVVWNRPAETRRVLEALRPVRPSRLYVACDGPRSNEEAHLVDEVRELVATMVDWPCQVLTNYSSTNSGCRVGVTRAIDWFFEHEDEGIILEDDCIPHPDFFPFCDEILARYRNDDRVMHIAGDNTAAVTIPQDWSYCFVRYPHIWGWATWRRAWRHYDRDLKGWSAFRNSEQLPDLFPEPEMRETWVPIFNRLLDEGIPDTWDWQWAATTLMRNGLCIQPTRNLISNIGFNERATHTRRASVRAEAPLESILPLRHPPVVFPHRQAESQIFENTQASLHPRAKVSRWKKVLVRNKVRLYRLAQRVGLRP